MKGMRRKDFTKANKNNTKFFYSISFILTILKVILTQKTIAIHFYEIQESYLANNKIKNPCNFDNCLNSINENLVQFSFDSNTRVSHVFLIYLNIFYLNFSNEEEILESQQYNMYIDNDVINHDGFVYFYNTVMSFPNIIDTLNEYKYRLIFKILYILKIKTDKKFEDFIRLMLYSLAFHSIATKEWNCIISKEIEYYFSSVISKKVIVELFALYWISERTLEKLRDISHTAKLIEYFSFDFIDLNEEYFYLDDDIMQEIYKIHKISKNFLKILDFLFRIHKFNSIFLCGISYREESNFFFNLSLFKNLNKLFINKCSNTDILIQKIINICGSGCIKTVNIIRSTFTMKDEITWLKMFDFKSVNHIVEYNGGANCGFHSDFDLLVPNVFSRLIDEIYNENESNIFVRTDETCRYYQEKKFSVELYQAKDYLEIFKTKDSPIQTFICTKLFNSFLSFDFYNINFREFKNIQIKFTNNYIKDFKLPGFEILNVIRSVIISESTLNALFLSKILMFPFLKEISLKNCTITPLKNKIDFIENIKIEKFYFGTSKVDDQYHFFEFVNHMIGLKVLSVYISYGFIDSNIFRFKLDNFTNIANLKFLSYHIFPFSKDIVPIFPIFLPLLQFNFGSNYPKGTLYSIFYGNNLSCLKILTIYNMDIGKEDESAFEKYTSLLSLIFSGYAKCFGINFFKLFNPNNVYSLVELKLPDIEITCMDLEFFSKLKFLKIIYIHRLSAQINIVHFLKSLLFVRKIEIKKISIYKNEIYEYYGDKTQKLFDLTYNVNLDV